MKKFHILSKFVDEIPRDPNVTTIDTSSKTQVELVHDESGSMAEVTVVDSIAHHHLALNLLWPLPDLLVPV